MSESQPQVITGSGIDTQPIRTRPKIGFRLGWSLLLVALLCLAAGASVAFGVRDITGADILGAFAGSTDSIGEAAVMTRMPRTVLAALVGASLGVFGTVVQGVTRNPLADPAILGVSSGASLAVVLGMVLGGVTDSILTMVLSIAGSASAAVFVYTVGSLGRGGATPLKLALAGAAISAAFRSVTAAVLLPRADVMESYRQWQIGGVGSATWERIGLALPFMAIGALICVGTARGMNSLSLGDDVATGLGERVARTRALASAGAVILCGAATAVAGPIGFVGLVIPHMCRLLFGVDHRWLVPVTAVAGALLLVLADLAGRILVAGEQIDVGIITPVIGAPLFIWIVRRQKVREL